MKKVTVVMSFIILIVTERVGEFKKSVEATKRKKRNANPISRLDLSEKNEFTYKLVNKVDGMPFAQDSVDIAFESWSNAIVSAVTFTSTVSSLLSYYSITFILKETIMLFNGRLLILCII